MTETATPGADPVRIGAVADFDVDSARRIDIDGHRVAVVRIADDFYAIGDQCSHADVSLAEGDVDTDELALECWKHGSLFCLKSGEALTLPAIRPVPVYTVTVDGDDVLLGLGTEEASR